MRPGAPEKPHASQPRDDVQKASPGRRNGHGLADAVFLLNDVEDRAQNIDALGAAAYGTFAS